VKSGWNYVEAVEDFDSGYVEWVALELHKKFRFTHVVVLYESDLIRGARVRSILGISSSGQSVENALLYRDKVLMKTCVKKFGLDVPNFASVEGAGDIIGFVKQYGYPVVVKPRLGYSSVNTSVLRSEEELKHFIIENMKVPGIDPVFGLEVESFVQGPMYHIDGMVLDGKVVLSWPSKYVGTVMQFQKNRYIAGYNLHPNNPLVKRLNEYIENVITSLGAELHPNPLHFPFHAEAWHTPDDHIVLCEIASRGGGGNIKKQIKELFDVVLDEIWTAAQVGDVLPTKFQENVDKFVTWRNFMPVKDYLVGWSYIYPKKGIIRKFPGSSGDNLELPSYCLHWQTFMELGQKFLGPKDCADTCVACLVKGYTEDEIVTNLDTICDWFFENSVWEDVNSNKF